MAEVKKKRLVVQYVVEDDDDSEPFEGKNRSGKRFIIPHKSLCSMNCEREIDIQFDNFKKQVLTIAVNGWTINKTGNAECVYCGKIIEGYDYGKANEVTRNFNIRTTPCTCRA